MHAIHVLAVSRWMAHNLEKKSKTKLCEGVAIGFEKPCSSVSLLLVLAMCPVKFLTAISMENGSQHVATVGTVRKEMLEMEVEGFCPGFDMQPLHLQQVVQKRKTCLIRWKPDLSMSHHG